MINNILKKIEKSNEVQNVKLEKHEVDLGIIQDDIKKVQAAQKEFEDGFLVISFARQKAIPMIKNAITNSKNFLAKVQETKKAAKELGVDLPQDYLNLEQKAGVLIGEAEDIITWINKY